MLKTISTKGRLVSLFSVLAIVFTFIQVPLASAASFSASWGYAKDVAFEYVDYCSNNCYVYGGELRDTSTPNGYCVEMQRKTSSGSWIRTGFVNDTTDKTNTTISACTTSYVRWAIASTQAAATYGIRMVDGSGRYLTMCNSQAECKALR